MSVTVFLDMDGVLVDFLGSACKLCKIKYDYHKKYPFEEGRWAVIEDMKIPRKKFWAPLGRDFWKNLPWIFDGHEILKSIQRDVSNNNIYLCTSPCDTAGCVDGKWDWVKKQLPGFKKQVIFTQDKSPLAGPRKILVDDGDHNIDAFYDAGGKVVRVPRRWNSLHPIWDGNNPAYVREQMVEKIEEIYGKVGWLRGA